MRTRLHAQHSHANSLSIAIVCLQGHYFANELKAKYGTGVIRTVRVGSLHRSVVIVPFQEHRLAREWEVAGTM